MELKNFGMEVKHLYLTKHYDLSNAEKVPIIKRRLGREGMKFIETLPAAEKELCPKVKDYLMPLVENSSPDTMKQCYIHNAANREEIQMNLQRNGWVD